jgi:methylthioribose-1-phosphate isomerase
MLGSLEILNQLLLPFETVYEELKSTTDAHAAIKTMKVIPMAYIQG